jgi:uncharacterized caspase-like protein
VQETLQHSQAQVKIFVFDACHSGALRGRSGGGSMSQIFAQWLFEELVKSEGWAVLSSCKQDELSHDYDEKEHGVFTYYFLEGLSGAADANADGVGPKCSNVLFHQQLASRILAFHLALLQRQDVI